MEHRFDTLAKSLAATVSRREAIARLGGGLAGAVLATLGLGRAWSAPAPNSKCEDFCRNRCGIIPGGGNAFGQCVSSCEACVNSTGAPPCGCPPAAGAAVVCTNCCLGRGEDVGALCGEECSILGACAACCSGSCAGFVCR